MQTLYPKIMEAKGLVLVSPTHHYNITAWMKAFIDRLYCFYDFSEDRPRNWSSRLADQHRKAVICAICEQPEKENMGFTLEAMRLPLQALGYEIVDELAVAGIFDRGYIRKNNEIINQAIDLGYKLAFNLEQ
jgi:multimeric flavodoxin WrbA